MRFTYRLIALGVALIVGSGCYDSNEEIDAVKRRTDCPDGGSTCFGEVPPSISMSMSSRLSIGPGKYVSIRLMGMVNGAHFTDRIAPVVTTTLGSFVDPAESAEPVRQTVTKVVDGDAFAKLYAPTSPGVATVTARVTSQSGVTTSATATVTFIESRAAQLIFGCVTDNIGVLADPSDDFYVDCAAMALDQAPSIMKNPDVRFLTEAGSLRPNSHGTDIMPEFNYFPRQGDRVLPEDVAPLPGEPSVVEGEVTRNPRDMLTTLVAFVEGDNPQTGDMFSGDPFVDMNDNQRRDADEPFFSATGSETYSPAQTKIVWSQAKIVWTGKLTHSTCAVSPGMSADLDRGGTTSFAYTLRDENFNVLAANSSADRLTWQLEPWGDLTNDTEQKLFVPLAEGETGFALDKRGNFPEETTAASFGVNGTYTVKVQNARGAQAGDDLPYSVSGTLRRTLTIDEKGEAVRGLDNEVLPTCGGILH